MPRRLNLSLNKLTAAQKLSVDKDQLPQANPQKRLFKRLNGLALGHAAIEFAEDVALERLHGLLGNVTELLVNGVGKAQDALRRTVVNTIAVARVLRVLRHPDLEHASQFSDPVNKVELGERLASIAAVGGNSLFGAHLGQVVVPAIRPIRVSHYKGFDGLPERGLRFV
jgi:hypothetical protein